MNAENQMSCGTNTCNCGPDCRCKKSGCCWCKISLAFALVKGVWIFVLGMLGTYYGYGLKMIEALGSLYPGYEPTVKGSIAGAISSFVHVFILFLLAGLFYKLLKACCTRCVCRSACNKKEGTSCSKE